MLTKLFLAVYNDGWLGMYDGKNGKVAGEINFGKALLISLVAILIVFVVLLIIIGAVKLMEIAFKKFAKAPKEATSDAMPVAEEVKSTVIEDEDMMVAALIATIDYTNETKTDAKLKSIKRIG